MSYLDFETARDLLMERVSAVETENIPLSACGGRVLAEVLTAAENIPPFDRSPYDGYAFRAEDTANASKEHPVTLSILEEVPAGAVPTKAVTAGTATKILTGAPVPEGANTICPYEETAFTPENVTLFRAYKSGANIVTAGEDVREGEVLAQAGSVIDGGTAGTLAAQGVTMPRVYRRVRVGILSTGNEVVEADEALAPGKIRNSNRHTLETILKNAGFEPVYLGLAGDRTEKISSLIARGLAECDAVISTGGVSVGDYDLTPDAMEQAGVETLFRGVNLKPGMACCYGIKDGKPVCGLSGNPASSVTNFYAIALPALRKLAGYREAKLPEIQVKVAGGFKKKGGMTRLLRGVLDLSDGTARMHMIRDQGNVVLSSTIGCNVMAVVPAGSDPVENDAVLKGFLL